VASIDTAPLSGVSSTVVESKGITVINPVYLLPAQAHPNVDCNNYPQSQSIATLWALAVVKAKDLTASPSAGTDPAKTALAQFQKVSDAFLAADKGLPLLGKLLIVESMLLTITDPAHTAVIDMKLDGAGIDSTTRAIFWWWKTRISANVLAHYSILKVAKDSSKLALILVKPGYANCLITGVDQNGFAVPTSPHGTINGKPVPEAARR
jgi:hypothetical protein